MEMLGKIRRMYFRDKLYICDDSKSESYYRSDARNGLSSA